MQIAPRIAHMGLLLIALPLAFEIIVVVALVLMLQSADADTRKQARAKAIITETTDLEKSLEQSGYTLLIWRASRSQSLAERYDRLAQEIPGSYVRLKELAKGDPDLERHVLNLETFGKRITYLTANFRHPKDQGMLLIMDRQTYRDELQTAYKALLAEVDEVVGIENAVRKTDTTIESRQRVYQALALIVLSSVVLAVCLALYFSKNITNRLRVLEDNTVRFASGVELKPRMSGKDEIAEIDGVFHYMADALTRAEQSKQEYILMVTHDLRTPLNSVAGSVEMLASGICGELSELGESTVARAEDQLNRVLAMINDWLDVEKIQSGMSQPERQALSLKSLAKEVVDGVQPLAKKTNVTIDYDQTDVTLYADRDMISRVITNLLGNSLKFAPNDSTISINGSHNGSGTRVEIRDKGRGIPEQMRGKIFERFTQVEKSDATVKKGSGLGLTICKAIVETHNGRIGVDSEEGKGSTFWFWLPDKK